MTDLDLCYLPATEQLRLFRSGRLSPVEVLDAQIARSEDVEGQVNAFADRYFEEARVSAVEAERRYARGSARVLEGVTLAVKEEHDIVGKQTCNGSLTQVGSIAERTHPMVQRLVDAGAVVHAKTTIPEFSMAPFCWTKVWGVTRNPWNLHYTPGGSSGGSGAALAAGTATLATGSDIGGSIRVPASLNGLYGFKPPHGRNPTVAPWGLVPYAVEGGLARTLPDMALYQRVVAGPDPGDVAGLPRAELPDRFDGAAGMRVAYDLDLGFSPLDPDVRANTEAALGRLADLGVELVEVDLGWSLEQVMGPAMVALSAGLPGLPMTEGVAADAEAVCSYTRTWATGSGRYSDRDVFAAGEEMGRINRPVAALFDAGFDAFVCPTTAVPSVPADIDPQTATLEIDGHMVDPFGEWVLTYPFNLLFRHPVMSVPTGRATSNVPTGMQIVGPALDDARVFRLGAAHALATSPLFTPGSLPDLRDEQ